MNYQIETLAETVKQRISGSPSGISCVFVSLDDDNGIKLFYSERERDKVYDAQAQCLAVGLAPNLGQKVDLPTGSMRFGYITEKVVVLYESGNNELGGLYTAWNEVENNCDDPDDYDYDPETNPFKLVHDKLYADAGWDFQDAHSKNWGIKKDGQIVPIDFGNDGF